MKNLFNKIKKEFDPRHDFDRIGPLWDCFRKYENKPSIKSFGRTLGRATYWYANGFVKSIVRYGLPAMGLGALGAYVIWENPNTGAVWAGGIVAGIDACQYGVRSSVIPIGRDLFNFFKKSSNREILS